MAAPWQLMDTYSVRDRMLAKSAGVHGTIVQHVPGYTSVPVVGYNNIMGAFIRKTIKEEFEFDKQLTVEKADYNEPRRYGKRL